MIIRNGQNIKNIYTRGLNIGKIYHNGLLVFTTESKDYESSSCFGSGYWINVLPWLNDDAWKNN